VVILIHGRGQDPRDLDDMIVARVGLPDVAYVAPQAADRTWYPLGFMMPVEQNQPRLDLALARIAALADELAAQGMPLEEQVIFGFSQGACLASEYVFRRGQRVAALCAFTGGLIGPDGTAWEAAGTPFEGMPVLLGGASQDPWVPAARMLETAAVFRQLGARVDAPIYPSVVHEINDDQIGRARAILTAILESRRW
jgi:phospholipase/carboxylesterase